MTIKTLELKGTNSYTAMQVFHKLMLGLKMLPSYGHLSYEEFYKMMDLLSDQEKERKIREAALFVSLEKDELEALIYFCADKNGVRYGPENMKALSPDQIMELIVAASIEFSKIQINFLSEAEKKN